MSASFQSHRDITQRSLRQVDDASAHAGRTAGRRIRHRDADGFGCGIISVADRKCKLICSYLCRAWPESEDTRSSVEARISHQRQRRHVEVYWSAGAARGRYGESQGLPEIDHLVADRIEN